MKAARGVVVALCLLLSLWEAKAAFYTTNTITDIGGAGCYPEVVNMVPGAYPSCTIPSADNCVKKPLFRNSSLAPFDEELTMVFRGPMNMYNLAVYAPSNGGSTWNRVSYWDPSTSNNVVFFNNNGGGLSGEFTFCGGNSQSYASANGTKAAASPTQFAGYLANDVSVNALTGNSCGGAGTCGAFYRNVSNHGWAGDSLGRKAFIVRLNMPNYTGASTGYYSNCPAYWILNAKIVHTAQFGCNCRGVGSQGGCGELDVAEVVNGDDLNRASTTIYSFRGAIGGAPAFQRPWTTPVVYIVIFDSANTGTIQITTASSFDFNQGSLSQATIDGYLSAQDYTMSLAGRTPSPAYSCGSNPIIGPTNGGPPSTTSGTSASSDAAALASWLSGSLL